MKLYYAPRAGTMERYRLQEMLNFITSEIHKSFSPLFNPNAAPEWKQAANANLARRFEFLARHLEGKDYLLGKQFTVADGYLFTVLNWTGRVGIDLGKWPVLQAYVARAVAHPKVQEALKAEGLVK